MVALGLVMVLVASGCAATSGLSAPTGANHSGSALAASGGASADLTTARNLMQSGRYSQAIPRLLHAVDASSSPSSVAEAHYYLGLSYRALESPTDARRHFEEVGRLAPESHLNEEAQTYLAEIRGEKPAEAPDEQQPAYQFDSDEPDALARGLELADESWREARYGESGAIYIQLLEAYPALARDPVISERIALDDNGGYTLLTPESQVQQAGDANPLVIINTNTFRSGRYEGYTRTFQELHYNVTGEVLNRGSATLRNVEVEVTIYGFGSRIMDTRTLQIGTLRPDQRRPFSTRFSNFENIENVNRYEVTGYYE